MQSFDFVCSIGKLQCILKFENYNAFDLVRSSICQTNNFFIGNDTGTLFSLVHVWLSGIHNRHHVYKYVWTPFHGEKLSCGNQLNNVYDKYAVKVVKNTETVGDPWAISPYITYILANGGKVTVKVIGSRQNWRGNGLEVPGLYNYTKLKAHM